MKTRTGVEVPSAYKESWIGMMPTFAHENAGMPMFTLIQGLTWGSIFYKKFVLTKVGELCSLNMEYSAEKST